MIQVYLNSKFKTDHYTLPPEYVQWNEMVVRVYSALTPYSTIMAMNFVKPNGVLAPQMYMSYKGFDEELQLNYWETTLIPWHTAIIPGDSDFGMSVITFTYKIFQNNEYVNWYNSAIIRVPITRSTEPQPIIIEPHVSEQLWLKIDELEQKISEYVPPFTIKGVVEYLSDLWAITAAINDVYKVNETNELWLWNGLTWISIGLVDGMQGPPGQATYLHVAYADSPDGTLNFSLHPTGRSYIGIYRDYEEFQSADPEDYEWTLLKGADGADGRDGVSGKNAYLHIAWANSANGTVGFSTTVSTNKLYIGTYTDFISTDSQNPSYYNWSLIRGADGANGTDGTDGLSAYLHIAYADSPDGSVGFSVDISEGKAYIGTYTNFVESDSLDYWDYKWTRIKGDAGADGTDGDKGEPAYIHIAWATSSDGLENFSTSAFIGATYMGTYTDSIETDSNIYTDYDWVLIKGEAGADGKDGDDGLTAYIHIAYADSADGSIGFSSTVSANKSYIGTYTDFTEADSENYSDYKWTLIKGADGSDGSDGTDGQSAFWHIAYSNAADGSVDFSTTDSTNRAYIGTYTDFVEADSMDYADYTWVLIKGADGSDGTDGVDGDSAYIHVAWSNSSDGSVDFSTSVAANKTYIGTYTDFNSVGSEIYTDYTWILIKGADGADGSDGADGLNAYLHIAYSNSADGSVDFSTTAFSTATYIGTYTDFSATDSEIYTDYKWVLIKGADGADGSDGINGQSSYLHIAWANSADGSVDFSRTVSAGKSYIGTYTDFIEADSESYGDYKWTLIKGADGSDGSDGIDGESAYLHIAYSTSSDGSANFSTTVFESAVYMGTYTDFNSIDSETYTDYTWVKIRGNDGTDGTDGQSMYLHIAYATNATGSTGFSLTYTGNETYIGTYTDTIITDSTNPTKYSWKLFKGKDGQDGTDGTSVVLKGSVATIGNLPSGAAIGDLYVVLADGDGYVWNGSTWDNVGQIQGPPGADGVDGNDGATTYVHYAYSTSSNGVTNFSLTPFVGALYLGIYTDFTLADSTEPTDYDWALIKGADGVDGADGNNGLNAYIHYAYASSSDGSVGFSTAYTGTETYVGWYTDFTQADSTTYTDYEWSLFKGQDGLDGNDGENGLPSYIHYAYATSSDGSQGFSLTYTGNESYVGWYTDFTEADSTTYSDYKWAIFKGADGAKGENGLSAYIHYAYATSSDGSTGFSTTYTGSETYVGWYTDFSPTDSTTYTDYKWQLFKGLDGLNGNDGLTAYIHYAYATNSNGTSGFSLTYTGVETHVGWYSDYTLADSTNPADYKWSLFKGADGADGKDGSDGIPAYIHYAYSTASDGSANFSLTYTGVENYIGWYTDFTKADSTTYSDYEWQLFKGADGANGEDGSNGLSAYIHYAYANSSDGSVGFSTTYTGSEKYVGWYSDFTEADSTTYTDYKWALFTGQDGVDGADGEDGLPAYIHYAYATSSDGSVGFTTTYTGVEKYVGWYSDFTEADSNIYTDYEWALFKGADGADGENGLTAYIHYAYATSSNGAQGFSTTYTGVEKYVGWYTDFSAADSTDYRDYEWKLFKGADGLNGKDGNDGLNAYVHYAYATSSDGSQGFTLEYTGVETYVGWYTDFTPADSSVYTDYEWQLFKGADGVDGLNAFIHYAYANNENGTSGFSLTYTGSQTYVGWYTSFSSIRSTNPADYEWSRFRGLDGAAGPGLIYRGLYSSIKVYYANADRRDVVQYGGSYYVAKAAYSPITGTWNSAKWTQMQYFESVATDILLANDAAINKTLIIGDGTTGALRSYGMSGLNDTNGAGFYLDGMTGHMTLGDGDGQNLKWNGSKLDIKGDITADNLTLSNNATITKRLTMGSYSEKGAIASYGMNSLTGTIGGFYMDGNGSFIFGKYNGKHVSWDGSELRVVDTLYETSIEQGANFLFTIKGKNNTNSPIAWYYKKWPLVGYTEPSTWTYIGSIPANGQSSMTTTSAPVNGYNWNYKVRFGTTSNFIYEPELTLNHYGEYSSGLNNVYSAISGGTVFDMTKKRIPWNIDGYNATGAAYLSIISGVILVSSTTGTATVTLVENITSATGVASPYTNNSSGGGGDFAYMEISPNTTKTFTVTKDYTETSNSRYVSFIIIGMEG